MHDSAGWTHCRHRYDPAERVASAVSSCLQRGTVLERVAQQVFPVHRIGRSEVRSRTDGRLPRESWRGRHCGSAEMRIGVKKPCGRNRLFLLAAAVLLAGCSRLDMQDQPKYKFERGSDFFADGRSDRPELDGTIARGS